MANIEAINKLKRGRGITKGQLTRAFNWIRAFNKREQTIEGVEVRFSVIEKTWIDFREKQDALIDLNPAFENDGELEEFEAEYYAAAAAAKAIIATKQQANQIQNNVIDNQNVSNRISPINQRKLPPINLPSFNESYDQWPNFRDTFKAVIDENEHLSDIKKLYYLRLALKGVAAEIIASIEMSAENYEIAWNHLEGHFENKRVLVHYHLQALI
ncbi:Peptidase aspartic putative domain-containing protein [Camponotus japonicus]